MWDWVTYDPKRPAGRMTFVLGGVLVPVLLMFALGYASGLLVMRTGDMSWLDTGRMISRVLVWVLGGIMAARRLLDMGQSRAWALLIFVPLVSWVFLAVLVFVSGKQPVSTAAEASDDVLSGDGLADTLAEVNQDA